MYRLPALEDAHEQEQSTADSNEYHRRDQAEIVAPVETLASSSKQTFAEPQKGDLSQGGRPREKDLEDYVEFLDRREPVGSYIPYVTVPAVTLSGYRGDHTHCNREALESVSSNTARSEISPHTRAATIKISSRPGLHVIRSRVYRRSSVTINATLKQTTLTMIAP